MITETIDFAESAEATGKIVMIDWERRRVMLELTEGQIGGISAGDRWYLIRQVQRETEPVSEPADDGPSIDFCLCEHPAMTIADPNRCARCGGSLLE